LLSGGDEVPYLLRDEFSDTLAAGSVHGTPATPGPGTRTVVDTESKLSIGSGVASFAGGKAAPAYGDPAIMLDAITRSSGRMLRIDVTPTVAGQSRIGWEPSARKLYVENGVNFSGGVLYFLQNDIGVLVGLYTNVLTTFYVILRNNGCFLFRKNGQLQLIYVSASGNTASLLPFGVAYNTPMLVDSIRVPDALWLPTPLASDGFAGSWDSFDRADGAVGDAESGESWGFTGSGYLDAQIVSNRFVGGAQSVGSLNSIYAYFTAAYQPGSMGGYFSFVVGTGGGAPSAIAVILSKDASPSLSNMLHLVVSTTGWGVTWWQPGLINQQMASGTPSGTFGTPLASDGTSYHVELSFVGNDVTVTINGVSYTCSDPHVSDVVGPLMIWQLAYNGTTTTLPRWDSVYSSAFPLTDSVGLDSQATPQRTWTVQAGTVAATGGNIAASALATGEAIATFDSGVADVILRVPITRAAGVCGGIVRWVDASNYIRASHDGTNCLLEKIVAGTPSTVITAAATYSAGAHIVVDASGTAMRLYYNNALVGTGTVADAALLSGTVQGWRTTDIGNTSTDIECWAKGTGGEYAELDRY